MAHTPGPWNVVNTMPSDAMDIAVIFDEQSQCVCSVPTGSSNKPMQERRANARLIAAAPDLLALVKSLIDTREWHSIDNTVCAGWDEKARAAIAKAEAA